MRLSLDTNRYVDFCKGVAGAAATLETAEAVFGLIQLRGPGAAPPDARSP